MALILLDIDEVRLNSGFDENDNITDAEISIKCSAAEAEIFSAVGVQYPLDFLTDSKFEGSLAKDFLKNLALEYASALLLYTQYKGVDIDYSAEAGKRIGQARAEISRLQDGKIRLLLSDYSEVSKKENSRSSIVGEFPEKQVNKSLVF